MYDSLFTMPPADVAALILKSADGNATLSLRRAGTYFITIMPFDVYGESIGRTLYPESNELRVRVP